MSLGQKKNGKSIVLSGGFCLFDLGAKEKLFTFEQ